MRSPSCQVPESAAFGESLKVDVECEADVTAPYSSSCTPRTEDEGTVMVAALPPSDLRVPSGITLMRPGGTPCQPRRMVSTGTTRAVLRPTADVLRRTGRAAGVMVPFLYFGTQLVVGLATPGYSFTLQAASELGAVGAPHAAWFNGGAVLTGVATLFAAVALGSEVVRAGSRRVLTGLTALAVASVGWGALAAGMFPLPDHRHGGGPGGVGAFVLPLLTAVLLRPRPGQDGGRRRLPGVRWYPVVNLALFAAGIAVTSGAAGMDLTDRHGAVQRLLAITLFVPIAVLALAADAGREGCRRLG